MVKQFTIPCQFQQSTSPVTLYIGHPEFTHHPVHFQSEWLSSAKGGTIPQDLMDTLQNLHDLANQNGADFEELCYYALISATKHSVGTGVSKDDINKYAKEYVQSDGQVAQTATETNKATTENAENNNKDVQQNKTGQQTDRKIAPSIQPSVKDTTNGKKAQQAANDEDSLIGDSQTVSKEEEQRNNDVLEQLGKIEDNKNNTNNTNNNIEAINMSATTATSNSNKNNAGEAVYTQEDEDLLLEDDMTTIQDEERAKELEKMITDKMNEILAKQEQRELEEKAKTSVGEKDDATNANDTTVEKTNNSNFNTNLDTNSNTTDNDNNDSNAGVYSAEDEDLFE